MPAIVETQRAALRGEPTIGKTESPAVTELVQNPLIYGDDSAQRRDSFLRGLCTMPLAIDSLSPDQDSAWDSFVLQHPHGSPFHLTAWKHSIEQTFGFRPYYLMAKEGGVLQAVLPLFMVRNPLIGKALISTPFAVYGGVLARTDEGREAVRSEVRRLGESLRVDYVELRNAWPEQCLGFVNVSRYVTFTQVVGKDEAAIMESIPRKTRYMVRKSLKHPFSTRQTRDPKEFEKLYSQNLRRLGTPSFPARHFTALLDRFGPNADIREVLLEGKVVAAVMSFYFRDQALPYYGAADPEFNEFAPSNYMYFDLMRWAGANGLKTFDFGRSKTLSGSFDFKAHWGMEMRELPYEILLVRKKEVPNYSPNNPRLQWAIKLWQQVPLPITRALGPFLIKLVP